MKIYLSGSIKKSNDYGTTDHWTEEDKAKISQALDPVSVQFLDPNIRTDSLADSFATFGRDMLQVFASDLVLVDARDKRGIGVGAEMAFAKMRKIPVISLTPPESYYKRTNVVILDQELDTWVHPFVFSLSDFLAATIEEAGVWIKSMLLTNKATIRGPECFNAGISHYLDTQLKNESAMHHLILQEQQLLEKLNRLIQKSN